MSHAAREAKAKAFGIGTLDFIHGFKLQMRLRRSVAQFG
ncbi:protein of unknown function [Methylocella tundrae]|uniref:Uncharacterized protein n=1 Tax=Methylocella tundrae TaxID=227605 RepID=A0A4U8YX96_METTU|nr:protein of unknown function [Methylocella tundrae]